MNENENNGLQEEEIEEPELGAGEDIPSDGDSGDWGTNLTWTLTNSGTLIITGTGAMNNFSGSSDTRAWRRYYNKITNVIINDITSIGNFAFANCSNLLSVTISEDVTSIGGNAFTGCSGLANVTIPNSVTSIGFYAFKDCVSLTSVEIGDQVEDIQYNTFSNSPNLMNISVSEINSTYASIDGVLFNKDITTLIAYPRGKSGSYIIPNSITNIGARAFYYHDNLTSVTIPNAVKTIGSEAFAGCSSLLNIIIPNGVTNIGNGAFYLCTALTSVTISNSVTSIGDYSFAGCSSLTSAIISNSVTSIGDQAFTDCTHLTSVMIRNSVTSIGNRAFYNCNSLSNVYYSGTQEDWDMISIGSDNEPLRNATIQLTIIAAGNCGNNLTWVLDATGTLTISGTGAMTNYDDKQHPGNSQIRLTKAPWGDYYEDILKIIIENDITSLGNRAFRGLYKVKEVEFPTDSLITIGTTVFSYCTSLTSVTVPSSVKTIGQYCFQGCRTTQNLNGITDSSFNKGLERITLSDQISIIDKACFAYCSQLEEIHLPSQLTTINGGVNAGAFQSCSSLNNIVIPDKVTSIGEYTFQDCSSLNNIVIPDKVTNIGEHAFRNCAFIEFSFPSKLSIINRSVLSGCQKLEKITLPNIIKEIYYHAFWEVGRLLDSNKQCKVIYKDSKIFWDNNVKFYNQDDEPIPVPEIKNAFETSGTWNNGEAPLQSENFSKIKFIYRENKVLHSRMKQKSDTYTNWAKATNFIPLDGEIIVYQPDNEHAEVGIKIGNGRTLVEELPFLTASSSGGSGGSDISEYIESVSVDGNTLTINPHNDDSITFTPQGENQPNSYIQTISKSNDGNTLTIIPNTGDEITFTPKGEGKPSSYIQTISYQAYLTGDNFLTVKNQSDSSTSYKLNQINGKTIRIVSTLPALPNENTLYIVIGE